MLKLEENSEAVQGLLDLASKEKPARIVSVIGATHSGKSAILNLLGERKPYLRRIYLFSPFRTSKKGVKVAEGAAPTSANVNLFDCNGTWFLDVEGDSGGNIMPVNEKHSEVLIW